MLDADVKYGMLCALLGTSKGTQHPKDPLNRSRGARHYPATVRPSFLEKQKQ